MKTITRQDRPLNFAFAFALATSLACFWVSNLKAQSIWSNNITATNPSSANPFTTGDVVASNLTVSGIGRGSGINAVSASDRYAADGWNSASINLNDHFYFTLTPSAGFEIDFTSFTYTGQRSGSGPSSFALRSSIDSYAANIGSPTATGATIDLSGATYQNLTSAVTFRLYGWAASAAGGTFSVNDFTFNGTISSVSSPTTWTGTGSGGTWQDGAIGKFSSAYTNNLTNTVTFAGTGETVTTSGTVEAGSLTFSSTGYTLNGSLTLGVGNITASTGSATINAALAGSTGVTKLGTGTLNIAGVNTYSGNTTVSAGVLAVSNASALGASGSANRTVVSSGAALEVSGGVNIASEEFTISGTGISGGGAIRSTSGDNTLGGDIVLGAVARVNTDAGSLTLGGNVTNGGFLLTVGGSGSTTVSGNISGSGGLTKDGSGTLVLSGASDYTGITTVGSGVLNVRNSSALGTVAGSTTVASGAALELQGGIAVGAEGLSIVGTGVSNGGAVRNISGTNTFAGAVTMSGASRINSDSGTLGFTGTVSMGSSILTVGGAGATYFSGALSSGNLTVESGSVTLNGTTANTYLGTTSVTGGELTLAKTAGTNAVAGNLSVSGGTVRLGASDQIANTSAVTVSGGSIDLGGYSEGVGAVVISGGASIGNGTFSGANYTLSGSTISANLTGSGAMSVTAGTNTLSGNSSGYSGAVTVAGGTLNVAADNALGSGDVSLRGGATLDATGASVIANNITINATSVSASQNFNSMGTSSTASLPTGWVASSAGAGTSGNYTSSIISATTQQASSGSPTAGGIYNWGNGSDTADRSVGFMTSGSYASPNSVMYRYENTSGATISSLDLAFDYERYRINTSAANVTFFTSTDGNTWTARTAGNSGAFSTGTSAYNFTSGTVVSANFTLSGLSVANGSSLYFRWLFDTTGSSSQGIGLDNFSMSFSDTTPATLGSSLEDSAVLYTGAIAVNSAANLLAGSGTTVSFNGSMSGNGSITKTGAGVVALNAANTLAGNATVSAGTLRLGAANALGNITSVTVNSTATLEVAVSGSVRDAAGVTLAGGTILRGAGVSETFGALTLSANSTIDFGSGATGNLTFASLTPAGFVLSLTNFTIGNALRFETGSFSASNFNFNGFDYTTSAFGDGFAITAIPEPTVILPILAFIGLFLWGERKRIPNQIRKRLRKLGLAKS